jgi:hypothetical protein
MAKKSKKPNSRTDAEELAENPQTPDRDEELSEDKDIHADLLELYKDIEKGFENQNERANSAMDYWDIFNCKLSGNQWYSGNSKIFLPIVHDAVEARVTRFANQIFPQVGRYIEVTSEDGTMPQGEMSLVEHYIRRCKLRTDIVPALIRNGDVEGQYNIYVSWVENKRHVAWRAQKPLQVVMQAGPDNESDLVDPTETVDDIEEKEIKEGRPHVEVIADTDICVLPATSDSITDALNAGGSVTILRRWSKYKINKMKKAKEIVEEVADNLLDEMKTEQQNKISDKPKAAADAAGVKVQGGMKHCLVYETWTQLLIGNERRLCKVYFGGADAVLSAKRNPYWSDRCPLFSVPVKKIQGSFKGQSLFRHVDTTQYFANDTINQAADSASFSMMPIVMTDPEKNPRVGTMVLSLAAVWECDPQSTQFAKFPDIWKSGFEIVASCKAQIMQTLSVSPAAMTQSSQQKTKPSQADIAREQSVDILTTADAVTVIEEGILTPLVNFAIELDHQYRNEKIMIRQFGEKGLKAKMDWVDPIQMGKRFSYRWFGVEQARNQQQIQMQIAGMNVIKGIPADQYPGYRLNMVPLITHLCENLYGPRLAPLIFEDIKSQLTLPPEIENQWMAQGFDLGVSPQDQDAEHIQAHQQLMQGGDPQGNVRAHLQRHMIQMQVKQKAQMMSQMATMMGQAPGGPMGAGPRQGAQPKPPRGGQGPPGMINRDSISAQSGAPPALRGRM